MRWFKMKKAVLNTIQ